VTDDSHRFTGMYDACRQRVWAYVVSRAGRQVADEVVSETFAIAWRRLDDVPEPALPWRAWAEGDVADQVTERMGVLRALAALGEDDREILVLVAWHDLSPKEAAKVIGCSSAAFRVRLHRARKRLKQAMEDVADPAHAPTAQPPLSPVRNLSKEWS
jgi:RNA polymerase sigma-70 factor (ECF subfamily)